MIDISNLLPSIPKNDEIQQLWSSFICLINSLKLGKDCDANEIETGEKQWVTKFRSVYQTKHVTPYVHALAMHVPEFVRKYGNISSFGQPGLEKLNDVTTTHYLRGTNHRKKDSEALFQLLQKRNRLEELEAEGYRRQKRVSTCSNCGDSGHNKRRCLTQIQLNRPNEESRSDS